MYACRMIQAGAGQIYLAGVLKVRVEHRGRSSGLNLFMKQRCQKFMNARHLRLRDKIRR